MWSVLNSDLEWLGNFAVQAGMALILPAPWTGYLAAVLVRTTEWTEIIKGVIWGWVGGLVTAVILAPLFWGTVELCWRNVQPPADLLNPLAVGSYFVGYAVCMAAQYLSAAAYLRWLDDPPLPAERRYSFSLRSLLVVQILAMMVFAAWIGLRRERIEQWRWEEKVRERQVK